MTIKRILAGLLLAAAAGLLAGHSESELVAAEQDKAKAKNVEKKALLKKLLEEKRKAQEQANTPAPVEKAVEPEAAVQKFTKPTGKPLDYKAVAGLIDREIDKQLKAEKIPASSRCDDSEFIRRASLDITGVIPTPERVVAFLESTDADKRGKLIDELLVNSNYGRRNADIWMNILYPPMDSDNRFITKDPLAKWLAEKFNANMPWDKMVTELLTSTGEQDKNGAVTYFMANRGVDKITDSISKAFLGIQLQCAQCHNHPFTTWKQTEYWGMAQFFMKVNANVQRNNKQTVDAGVTETDRPNRRNNPLPESAKTVKPKFLGGPEVTLPSGPSRPTFAAWATAPGNPYLAKAMVNRTWSLFFGRGFVNPVDDMLEENEASHPELLEALAKEFTLSGFDLKHLIRSICTSEAYQRSSKPLPGNKSDKEHFSHQAIKSLTPEQLFDSLTAVVGSVQERPMGKGPLAGAQRGGPRTPRDQFVAFFQPGESAKPTDYDAGIPQALRLMNSPRLANAPGLARELSRAGSNPDKVIEKLYLMTLARKPTAEETKRLTKYAAAQADAVTGYGDVLWALLNSSEFTLNR